MHNLGFKNGNSYWYMENDINKIKRTVKDKGNSKQRTHLYVRNNMVNKVLNLRQNVSE